MEKPIVFLRHSSADKVQLASLKALLDKRAAGCLEFFLSSDGQSIRFGRNWVSRISDALSNAKLMFAFISPKSVDSKWVHFEAGCAYANDIQIVPVCLPGIDLSLVTPPLSLLQGFNLHRFDSLSNIARTCNETFQLKIDEGFSHQDFTSVFSDSIALAQSFFGNTAWALQDVKFHLELSIPESESFDPIPLLKAICLEENREFLFEETEDQAKQQQKRFELPGFYLSGSQVLVGGGQGNQRSKRIHFAGTLSPELFHLNAPVLDKWYTRVPFEKPWSGSVQLKNEFGFETVRHQLTTKLYNSGIRVVDGSKFDFESLVFRLETRAGCSISFKCNGNLLDPRLPKLVNKLFELQIAFEKPQEFNPFE